MFEFSKGIIAVERSYSAKEYHYDALVGIKNKGLYDSWV